MMSKVWGLERQTFVAKELEIPFFTSGRALVMRVKDGCFGGVIARMVRGVSVGERGTTNLPHPASPVLARTRWN